MLAPAQLLSAVKHIHNYYGLWLRCQGGGAGFWPLLAVQLHFQI